KDHIVRGRVHHSAFGGNTIAPPKKGKNRPWDRKLSGRLRSLAGSLGEITTHAEAYCEALTARGQGKKTFSGVMYCRVREAKSNFDDILITAVHYTPLVDDKAHADLTFRGWCHTQEDRERFNLWLGDILHALHHPGQLQYLRDAEGILARLFHF